MSRLVGGALLAATLSSAASAADASLADKASSWIDRNPKRLVHALNQAGFYPSIGSLGEGAGSGPGLAYFAPGFGDSPLDLNVGGAFSFQGDTLFNVRLGRIPHVPGGAPSKRRTLEALTPSLVDGSNARPFFIYGEFRAQKLANGRVYGTDGDAAIPFVYNDESYEMVAGYRLTQRLVASVRAGWLETHATLDTDAGTAPSFLAGPAMSGQQQSFQATTLSLAYDRRDRAGDPRRGTFAEASLSRYDGHSGASSFDRVTLDLRQYVPLGSERHVIALRGFAQAVSGEAPIYLQHALGGSKTLRSYPQFRFRGPRLASLSAEYRFQVKGPFELAAFYDGGRVWGGASEMGTPGIVSSYGAGLRIKAHDDVLFRVDAANGSEGARVNLSFGYSF